MKYSGVTERTFTVKELILELLKLDKKDWNKAIEVEGCDCFQPATKITVNIDTVAIGH